MLAKEFSRLMRPDHFADYVRLQHFIETKTILYLPDGPIDAKVCIFNRRFNFPSWKSRVRFRSPAPSFQPVTTKRSSGPNPAESIKQQSPGCSALMGYCRRLRA